MALLDTGTSTSIICTKLAKLLKLKIIKDDSIVLRDASGKKMHVNGISYVYVDLYEGEYVRNSPSTRTRICVIVSSSLNSNEELLLSRSDLEKLRLILNNWPYV